MIWLDDPEPGSADGFPVLVKAIILGPPVQLIIIDISGEMSIKELSEVVMDVRYDLNKRKWVDASLIDED